MIELVKTSKIQQVVPSSGAIIKPWRFSEQAGSCSDKLTILLLGNISAENVKVALFIDGELVEQQLVKSITPGSTLPVFFTWLTTRGDHKLRVEVDPDNTIMETDETNNKKASSIEGKTEEDSALDKIFGEHSLYSLYLLFLLSL